MKHISIKISGSVQGIFFRASTKDMADQMCIKGFVRNERDGSVYVEAEGEDENLKQFVSWCHRGSSQAEVKNVYIEEGNLQRFTKFEIRR